MSFIYKVKPHLKIMGIKPYKLIDRFYLAMDKAHVNRTKNIRMIPSQKDRRGGKYSYAEWAHVIGIFQTLLNIHITKKTGCKILDVGCGTGLLGIACEPFLYDGGEYTGLDVMKEDIEFCVRHFPKDKYKFIHFNINNPVYAPDQEKNRLKWPPKDSCFNMVTALSVWTHLNEEEAVYYFKEIDRVLVPGGRAIITFFILDEMYESTISKRTQEEGRYNPTAQNMWIFSEPAYNSNAWFHPPWTKVPEDAIGITSEGLERLLHNTRMKKIMHYAGNWKEYPGIYFQDVLVFEKDRD
jgi:SAM-dependent methyltransferase